MYTISGYIWSYPIEVGILKKILDQSLILVKVFLFVTECKQHFGAKRIKIISFTSIYYCSQFWCYMSIRDFIHPFYMMMIIYKFQVNRKDRPLNIERGGACIYCKISLPLKIKNIHYVQECINFEIKTKDKFCNFISLYRSPNFQSFINNLELNLDSVMVNNPFLTVILGEFNVKSSFWYKSDITTHKCSKIDGVTSQFGLQ